MLAVAAVAIALFTSGCDSVSDGDVVVRVDDAELDRDTFTQLVNDREAADPNAIDAQNDPDRASGDTARAVAGQFVTLELVRLDLEGARRPGARGRRQPHRCRPLRRRVPGGRPDVGAARAASCSATSSCEAWYEHGPSESGVACVQHILVAEEAEAQAVLDRLEAGEAFGDVAAETSLDTQSGAQGGSLGCQPVSAFARRSSPSSWTDRWPPRSAFRHSRSSHSSAST